jgi:hypothetical protein
MTLPWDRQAAQYLEHSVTEGYLFGKRVRTRALQGMGTHACLTQHGRGAADIVTHHVQPPEPQVPKRCPNEAEPWISPTVAESDVRAAGVELSSSDVELGEPRSPKSWPHCPVR